MGFFRWLLNWLFGGQPQTTATTDGETVEDVADRIDAFGDRCRNAGDTAGADAARDASRRARQARTLEHAWQIERDFIDKYNPPPVKPKVGRHGGGEQYVAYGNNARVGGSVGWRNNNPGYIRCNDRLSRCTARPAVTASTRSSRTRNPAASRWWTTFATSTRTTRLKTPSGNNCRRKRGRRPRTG
ncbi:hypothetical protein [Limnoglobus roseus]|uniref:hypothetical protein n=1 Tax=Limnoglobus roseus TaxID=2598579 RepID=UPI0011EAA298|nr:hypothetical protein [Limnoglobus roseus]